jgi:superfamily II DNA or RNA helicase
MDEKILTQYRYNIYPVSLNPDEAEEYESLSKKILQQVAIRNQGNKIDESYLQQLSFRRSRLLDSLEDKFIQLDEVLKSKKPSPYTLFYSGSGSVESDDDPDDNNDDGTIRSISLITTILKKYNWYSSHFTHKESPLERQRILQSFKDKAIDAIAAIKVLDEGFDVPMCREAYITASSKNERQFIQRRGRILRRAKGKTESIIHDFVILHNDTDDVYKSLAESELLRVMEFYNSASNQDELLPKINKILKQYNISINTDDTHGE